MPKARLPALRRASAFFEIAVLGANLDRPPDRVPLHPFGPFRGNDQGFIFDEKSLAAIRAQLEERQVDYVLDWHHQTLDQERGLRDDAPAAGWISDIFVDDGFVYGKVKWTPKAANAVLNGEYRYISGVFSFDEEGRVLRYHSFGLLNRPGTHLQRAILAEGASDRRTARLELSYDDVRQRIHEALRQRFGDDPGWVFELYDDHFIFERPGGGLFDIKYHLEGDDVRFDSDPVEVERTYVRVTTEGAPSMNEILKAVLAALGLPETATKEQALAKLSELQAASQNFTALAALTGQSESTAILGAVQAMKNNQAQLTSLQAENERLKAEKRDDRIKELLDQGEEEGKLSPADRQAILTEDGYKFMRDDPAALESFLKLAAKKVDFKRKETTKPADAGTAALSAEEAEVAAQLGIKHDDFKAAKASYEGVN